MENRTGELIEVRFDRGLHVRVLQLGGEPATVMAPRRVHLAQRGRRRRLPFEACEIRLPAWSEFGGHASADEGPAHRRRLALQLSELSRVLGGKRFGNRGEELRHLHDRALETAKRRGQRRGLAVAVGIEPEQTSRGDAGSHAADIRAHTPVAHGAGTKAVLFLVCRHRHRLQSSTKGKAS